MMRTNLTMIAALSGAMVALASPGARASAEISADAVMRHVRVLSRDIGSRSHDSDASARAAGYIAAQLRAAGIRVHEDPPGDVDLPAVSVGSMHFFSASRTHVRDPNIWTSFGPVASAADPAVLIMAHYDTVHGSPGAVDNGAAVAIAIELGRSLAAEPPARPVIVAFTTAEEYRLAGAHGLAEILAERVGLAVSMDMIGPPGRLSLNGLGPRMGHDWLVFLARIADRAGVAVDAPLPHRVVSRAWPQIERSDHGAFAMRGRPALHLYTRTRSRVYLPYHTPLDTDEHIDAGSIADAARFVAVLARRAGDLPRSDGDPGFWVPGTSWVWPRWVLMAMELATMIWLVVALGLLVRGRARPRGPGLSLWFPAYIAAFALFGLACHALAASTGHPRPWVHAPARFLALGLVLAGAATVLGLMALSRWRALAGRERYLCTALGAQLVAGAALLAAGLAELAWLPLVSALLASALPWIRSRPLSWAVVAASFLPLLTYPLDPGLLREAVYNGFFLPSVPLAGFLGVMVAPWALVVTYAWRRAGVAVPGRWVAILALMLLVGAASGVLHHEPRCTGRAFLEYNLTCELPEAAAHHAASTAP